MAPVNECTGASLKTWSQPVVAAHGARVGDGSPQWCGPTGSGDGESSPTGRCSSWCAYEGWQPTMARAHRVGGRGVQPKERSPCAILHRALDFNEAPVRSHTGPISTKRHQCAHTQGPVFQRGPSALTQRGPSVVPHRAKDFNEAPVHSGRGAMTSKRPHCAHAQGPRLQRGLGAIPHRGHKYKGPSACYISALPHRSHDFKEAPVRFGTGAMTSKKPQ